MNEVKLGWYHTAISNKNTSLPRRGGIKCGPRAFAAVDRVVSSIDAYRKSGGFRKIELRRSDRGERGGETRSNKKDSKTQALV